MPSTPGSVTVHRAYGDITVVCNKEGYPDATTTVKSSTKGVMATNIIWGVFLPVGAAVDAATGAAYDYPAEFVGIGLVRIGCGSGPTLMTSARGYRL